MHVPTGSLTEPVSRVMATGTGDFEWQTWTVALAGIAAVLVVFATIVSVSRAALAKVRKQ